MSGRPAVRGLRAAAGVTTALALSLAACRPAGPPRTAPTTEVPDEEPTIRVGVQVQVDEAEVGSDSPYEIDTTAGERIARAAAGERWRFTADEAARIIARGPDGRELGPFTSSVRIRPSDDGGAIVIDGEPYRGAALIRGTENARVTVINTLALEDYLLGVVPAEIPATELEAVKAQAVAARTYAVGHLGHREQLGFDVFGTVSDQAYGGRAVEHPVTSRAVRETRGEILTWEGRPILAFYHSTCGGRTAAAHEVWRRAPVPYLQSVSDRIPGTDRYYCDTSNRFRWTEDWAGAELVAMVARGLEAYLGRAVRADRVERLDVTERTPSSDRAGRLSVAIDGERHEVRGDSIRWVLRPEADRILNSTLFELEVERDADGTIVGAHVDGGGWGHGVGMCQVGAIGRARSGQDYGEILAHYYRNTRLTRLY